MQQNPFAARKGGADSEIMPELTEPRTEVHHEFLAAVQEYRAAGENISAELDLHTLHDEDAFGQYIFRGASFVDSADRGTLDLRIPLVPPQCVVSGSPPPAPITPAYCTV